MKKYAILDSNVREGDFVASANMKYMRTSEPGLTRLEINKLGNKKFLKDTPSESAYQKIILRMINIICVAVRLKSNRLKRKALLDLNGVTLIERLIERLLSEFQNDEICICTSRHEDDEPLVEIAKKYSLNFVAGEELDVMSRFIEIGNRKQAENITRVTGDNPLTDPKIITQMLLDHIRKESDYTFCNQIPIGAGSEIVKFKTLKKTLLQAN